MPELVQCAQAAAGFSWSALMTGVVGIVGTIGGIVATNIGAGRRMRQQQTYEDSRRFHKERAELYGRVLALTQTFRLRAVDLKLAIRRPADDATVTRGWREVTATMVELRGIAKTAQLLGSPATQAAVKDLLFAAGELGKGAKADEAGDKALEEKLRSAESALQDAARGELVPVEEKT